MAKGLTPIIGLAVVVALALVAVFGAMSLTNPAFASVGAPADSDLAERGFTPQVDGTVEIEEGSTEFVDITSYIEGGRSAVADTGHSVAKNPANNDVVSNEAVVVNRETIELSMVGAGVGRVRVTATIIMDTAANQTVVLTVNVVAAPPSMPATATGSISDQMVDVASTVQGSATELDVSPYFAKGSGPKGGIEKYTVMSEIGVEVSDDDGTPAWGSLIDTETGKILLRASVGSEVGDNVVITVTVVDGIDDTGATQSFFVDVVAIVAPPAAVTDLVAESGNASVTLSWGDPVTADKVRITKYQIRSKKGTGSYSEWGEIKITDGSDAADVRRATVKGLTNGVEYSFQVRAVVSTKSGPPSDTAMAIPIAPAVPVDPSFVQSSNDPGDSANYTVRFQFAEGVTVNTRQNDLIIEFHEDYGFPASMRTTSVAITTTGAPYPTAGGTMTYTRTFTPEDVTVDGEKVLISLGDMDEQDDRFDYEVQGGEVVTVHFRQSAGITNPTEFGGYNLVGIEFGSVEIEYDEDVDPATPEDFETNIVRKISLSDGDGGLGDVITATGKGFKNGTTLTVYRDLLETVYWDNDDDSETEMVGLKPKDKALYLAAIADDSERGNTGPWFPGDDVIINGNLQAPSGELELGEDVLCVVASIGSDDVGRCEFTVTHPTFSGGLNYVNAVDGRDGYDISPADFLLKASITASPAGGSPGETIVIQVVDFPKGRPLTDVEISRQSLECGGCGGSADTTGADNFQIVIPNWVKAGSQELRVTSTLPNGDKVRASTNIDLLGPQINVTPGTVLANQRISLVGTGFSPGAVIANESDTTPGSVLPELSIGGRVIHGTRINDSDPVRVDNGGNWSASVDLPLAEATTADGERVIRVSDSRGRTGGVIVNIPSREVTVTPDQGRVGTIAVVRGTGFPSKNDEGSSFNVQIVYDASNGNTTTVSAEPDASGRFETQLRIPTTAAIPSSNSIKVSFRDSDQVVVVTTVAHEVPEGIITLSNTSGGPGSAVTVSGEGFKSFVPISLVKVGTLDVTPAPKPSTDGNGMMSFDILIPGLDVGIQTIEVSVGRTTSSTGFTVTESGVNPGDIKEVAPSLEDLGDNFVNIWNFNNDTKAWSFYDAQDGSDLTHLITGETYLLQIKATVEVILNGNTRNLTCVGGNCWNQIVW